MRSEEEEEPDERAERRGERTRSGAMGLQRSGGVRDQAQSLGRSTGINHWEASSGINHLGSSPGTKHGEAERFMATKDSMQSGIGIRGRVCNVVFGIDDVHR